MAQAGLRFFTKTRQRNTKPTSDPSRRDRIVPARDNHDLPSQVPVQCGDLRCADTPRTLVLEIDEIRSVSTGHIEVYHRRSIRVLAHERVPIGFRIRVTGSYHQIGRFDRWERAKPGRLDP